MIEKKYFDERHKKQMENFCKVRDYFFKRMSEFPYAYRMCWKKPYGFWSDHTVDEAITILSFEQWIDDMEWESKSKIKEEQKELWFQIFLAMDKEDREKRKEQL